MLLKLSSQFTTKEAMLRIADSVVGQGKFRDRQISSTAISSELAEGQEHPSVQNCGQKWSLWQNFGHEANP